MRPMPWLALCVVLLLAPAASSKANGAHSVLVIGDSLAVGTATYLPQFLPSWTLYQRAATGVRSAEAVERLRLVRTHVPGHLVVSLGTNDDPRLVSRFRQSVRAVLELAGAGNCVVWTNIVRPPVDGVSYARYNRVLLEETRLDPDLRVVDWAAMTRLHREWLRGDRVHATAAGYRARAGAVARALAGCAS